MKITDPVETDKFMKSPVLTDCLEFSSKLVSPGKPFKFSVQIGTSFVFNLSSIESGTSSSMKKYKKKKPLPSIKLMYNDKETLHCNQGKFKNIWGQELSEHMKAKHSKTYFKCDQCDSVLENEKGLGCHKGKKHKLTSSPIPQVDGQLEDIEVEQFEKEMLDERVEEEGLIQNGYLCKNFKFKCEGHETLNDHIKSCWEAQAQANTASS